MAEHTQDHHPVPIYQDSGIRQPYHLVSPSPLPFCGALAAGLLTSMMVLYMHSIKVGGIVVGVWAPLTGLLAVVTVMFFWWRDVIKEAFVLRLHTPIVKIGLRYGMALFITSEVFFFLAFFWAFFSSALFPAPATGGIWPPKGVIPIDPFDMPLMMTLILLLSGTTVTWAHHAMVSGNSRDCARALAVTVLLGVSFTCGQAYEYTHAPFAFKDGIFSSTFYMATGFHGLHVLIGTIFLAVCCWRTTKNQFSADSHFGLEAAAWYWHFVDVVWLFLFTAIYWWGSGGRGWVE